MTKVNKPLSRGTEIDTERCVANAGNRFDLVLMAAARAREIARNEREYNPHTHCNSAVSAILEVQEGKVGREYLKKVR